MQLHQVQLAKPITVLPARLADIEVELGISDFQRHLWDAFFDVYETTWHALEAAQNPGTIDHEDSAPGLMNVLEARHSRVMTAVAGLRVSLKWRSQ